MQIQNIVVAGKSGAGKQPRIDVLIQLYGLKQLSTGNIFREYLGAFGKIRRSVPVQTQAGLWRESTLAADEDIRKALQAEAEKAGVPLSSAVLGFKAAQYVDNGKFVPDAITNELFASAFRAAKGRGLVLDGYPRTPEQSDFLLKLAQECGTTLDLVLVVDNEDEAIVKRTIGRRICSNKACAKVFHLEHKPPKPDNTCTACGAPVIQRSDDTEEKIRTRLQEFRDKALPAIERLVAAGVPKAAVPGNLPVFTDQAVKDSVLAGLGQVLGSS